MMSGTENQFSLTRAVLRTRGRGKEQLSINVVVRSKADKSVRSKAE